MLPERFSESTTVKNEELINASDRAIWEFAKLNNYTIITQDSDFNDLNSLYGSPPKIIWIRTGNLKTMAIVDVIVDYSEEIEVFLKDIKYGCFEIFRLK